MIRIRVSYSGYCSQYKCTNESLLISLLYVLSDMMPHFVAKNECDLVFVSCIGDHWYCKDNYWVLFFVIELISISF